MDPRQSTPLRQSRDTPDAVRDTAPGPAVPAPAAGSPVPDAARPPSESPSARALLIDRPGPAASADAAFATCAILARLPPSDSTRQLPLSLRPAARDSSQLPVLRRPRRQPAPAHIRPRFARWPARPRTSQSHDAAFQNVAQPPFRASVLLASPALLHIRTDAVRHSHAHEHTGQTERHAGRVQVHDEHRQNAPQRHDQSERSDYVTAAHDVAPFSGSSWTTRNVGGGPPGTAPSATTHVCANNTTAVPSGAVAIIAGSIWSTVNTVSSPLKMARTLAPGSSTAGSMYAGNSIDVIAGLVSAQANGTPFLARLLIPPQLFLHCPLAASALARAPRSLACAQAPFVRCSSSRVPTFFLSELSSGCYGNLTHIDNESTQRFNSCLSFRFQSNNHSGRIQETQVILISVHHAPPGIRPVFR